MIDLVKTILGLTSADYDPFIAILCIAFLLYFMILFFNFVSSIFIRGNE